MMGSCRQRRKISGRSNAQSESSFRCFRNPTNGRTRCQYKGEQNIPSSVDVAGWRENLLYDGLKDPCVLCQGEHVEKELMKAFEDDIIEAWEESLIASEETDKTEKKNRS